MALSRDQDEFRGWRAQGQERERVTVADRPSRPSRRGEVAWLRALSPTPPALWSPTLGDQRRLCGPHSRASEDLNGPVVSRLKEKRETVPYQRPSTRLTFSKATCTIFERRGGAWPCMNGPLVSSAQPAPRSCPRASISSPAFGDFSLGSVRGDKAPSLANGPFWVPGWLDIHAGK